MKNNITVYVETKNGREEITKNRHLKIRERLLKLLFGDFCEVVILNPTKKVNEIQIKEVKNEV